MKTILIALIIVSGWSAAAVSAPYDIVQEETATATSPLGLSTFQRAVYERYSLTCQHTDQTVTVPSASAKSTVAITVHRC